jgi:hypothetical protein
VLHLRLIILSVEDDVPVDSESFLVIDFVNLKIKPTQSFECVYRGRVCTHIYRSECSYIYKYLRLYCVYKKTMVEKSRRNEGDLSCHSPLEVQVTASTSDPHSLWL